jgi:predicted nucleic acid-binding protein
LLLDRDLVLFTTPKAFEEFLRHMPDDKTALFTNVSVLDDARVAQFLDDADSIVRRIDPTDAHLVACALALPPLVERQGAQAPEAD